MSVAPGPELLDDPIARTRMAWVRTVLALIVLGFLLVRGVVVLEGAPLLAYLGAGLTVLAVATALTRFTALGRGVPRRMSPAVRGLVAGVVLALVAVGVAITLFATGA